MPPEVVIYKGRCTPVEVDWLVNELGVEKCEKDWRERGSLCQSGIRQWCYLRPVVVESDVGVAVAHKACNPFSGYSRDPLNFQTCLQTCAADPVERSFQINAINVTTLCFVPGSIDCVGKYQQGLFGFAPRSSTEKFSKSV